MLKVLALVAGLVALAPSICAAQTAPDVSNAQKVAAVREWVLHGNSQAKKDSVGGDAAKLLGMGRADLIGSTANYGSEEQGLGIYFMVLPGRSDVLLVRQDKKITRRVYWRMKKDGTLAGAVQRKDGKLTNVSGEVYDKAGMSILNYFYEHMKDDDSKKPK